MYKMMVQGFKVGISMSSCNCSRRCRVSRPHLLLTRPPFLDLSDMPYDGRLELVRIQVRQHIALYSHNVCPGLASCVRWVRSTKNARGIAP